MPTARTVSVSALLIPPGQDNIPVHPTDITVRTSRYDEAAVVSVTGLADAPDETIRTLPLTPEETRAAAQEQADQADGDEDEVAAIPVPETSFRIAVNGTPIGGGVVDDIAVDEEGAVSITAFDGVRKLLQASITVSFQDEVITTAIERVFAAANIPAIEDDPSFTAARPRYRIDAIETEIANRLENSQAGVAPFQVNREFTDAGCVTALNTLLRDVNWFFYTDPANVINIEPTLPSEGFDVRYITQTSAGKQTPPYQRVVVTGGRNATADEGSHMIGRDPVVGTAGEGEPVFRTTDHSITTQENADLAAKDILQELQRQQATGSVTVVGRPDIRPLDSVTLPDHLGGESYAVGSITHTINNTDGFITKIGCEGLLDAGTTSGTETGA